MHRARTSIFRVLDFYLLVVCTLLLTVAVNPWCLRDSISHSQDVVDIDISPDGHLFVVSSVSNEMIVYNMLTMSPIFTYDNSPKNVLTAKFSKDQQFIVMGSKASHTVRVFLARDPFTELGNFNAGHINTNGVDVNQQSDRILTCGDDRTVKMWSFNAAMSSFTQVNSKSDAEKIVSCSFGKKSNRIAIGT